MSISNMLLRRTFTFIPYPWNDWNAVLRHKDNNKWCVKRIDEYEQTVVFMDRTAIPIDQISEIESELFRGLELFDL